MGSSWGFLIVCQNPCVIQRQWARKKRSFVIMIIQFASSKMQQSYFLHPNNVYQQSQKLTKCFVGATCIPGGGWGGGGGGGGGGKVVYVGDKKYNQYVFQSSFPSLTLFLAPVGRK